MGIDQVRTKTMQLNQISIWFVLCISLYACQPATAPEINFSPTATSTPQEIHTPTPIQTVPPTEIIIDDDCFDTAFTQLAMNFCAAHHSKRTREFLEEIDSELKAILKKEDWEGLEENSQNWQHFKDLDCNWIADHYWGGSIRPYIYGTCIASHNKLRITLLSRFVCHAPPIPTVCANIQEYYKTELSLSISIDTYAENPCKLNSPANQEITDCIINHSLRVQKLLNEIEQAMEVETIETVSFFTTPSPPKPGSEGWPEELINFMSHRVENLSQVQPLYISVRNDFCEREGTVLSLSSVFDQTSNSSICYSAYNVHRINSIVAICRSCRELLEDIP